MKKDRKPSGMSSNVDYRWRSRTVPKVWLSESETGIYRVSLEPVEGAFEIEIKGSTYRNLDRVNKRFWGLQVVLDRWYHQARDKGTRRFV